MTRRLRPVPLAPGPAECTETREEENQPSSTLFLSKVPQPLPYTRVMLLYCNILTAAPLSLQCMVIVPQKCLFTLRLYLSFIAVSLLMLMIANLTGAFGLLDNNISMMGREKPFVIRLITKASNSVTVVHAFILIWLNFQQKLQFSKMLNVLQSLWTSCGSRFQHWRLMLGIILASISNLSMYLLQVENSIFPVNIVDTLIYSSASTKAANMSANVDDGIIPKFGRIGLLSLAALPLSWSVVCIQSITKSTLFWMVYIYGSIYICLQNISTHIRSLIENKIDSTLNARSPNVKSRLVTSSIDTLVNLLDLLEPLLSPGLFLTFVDFCLRLMEGFVHVQVLPSKLLCFILFFVSILAHVLLMVIAMGYVSLCAKLLSDLLKFMTLHQARVEYAALTDTAVNLRVIRMQPSAMGFFRADLRSLVTVTGSIITYSAILLDLFKSSNE